MPPPPARRFFVTIANELGLTPLYHSPRDVKILCFQRFVRLFANGACSLILAFYLSELGISDAKIGLFMSLTLLGNVTLAIILTLLCDRLGRRNILAAGAILMTASGLVFGLATSYWLLLFAAVFGVISPSGNEIGPFRAIEESVIAELTPRNHRSDVFAWYSLIGTLGQAFGNISCGQTVNHLRSEYGWDALRSYRIVIFAYAGLGLLKLILTIFLGKGCEVEKYNGSGAIVEHSSETSPLLQDQDNGDIAPPKIPKSLVPSVSKESIAVLIKLCVLFSIDSLASGLVPQSWITYFFHRKFHLQEGTLGTLFFVTSIISAFSNLLSAALSKRIGLVKAMVFTNLPSAVLLALIPIPNSSIVAMMLLIFRHCTNAMDNAPRSAFLSTVILPSERTVAMGIVNIVKTSSQSFGPVITGALAGAHLFWIAFVVAGGMKVMYNLGMLVIFINYKTQEERREAEIGEGANQSNDHIPEGERD